MADKTGTLHFLATLGANARCTNVLVCVGFPIFKNRIDRLFGMLLLASRMAALGSRRALTTLMPTAGHAAATASTLTSAANSAYNLPSRSSVPSPPYFSPSHWQQRRWMASSADLDRFDAHAQQLAAVIDAASESMVKERPHHTHQTRAQGLPIAPPIARSFVALFGLG